MQKFKLEDRLLHLIALTAIVAYVLPYAILGKNSHMAISDNLDSAFGWFYVLLNSGKALYSGVEPIPTIFNGLPRVGMISEINLLYFMYYLWGPLPAFIIIQLLMRFAAYIGLNLLLKDFAPEVKKAIRISVALAFAALPYWPLSQFSVAGIPLLTWAILRFRGNKGGIAEWAIIVLTSVTTIFFASHIFVLLAFFVMALHDLIRTRKVSSQYLLALFTLCFLYLIVEHRMFLQNINPAFAPHRNEFQFKTVNIYQALNSFREMFWHSHYHAQSVPKIINYTWIVAALLLLYQKTLNRTFVLMTSLALLFMAFFAIWHWEGLAEIKNHVALLRAFNLSRFFWLLPPILYFIFALSLNIIWKWNKFGKYIVLVALVIQTKNVILMHEQIQSWNSTPTFGQFYSEELFSEIKEYINKPLDSYRVVSVGLEPIIASWNGFYTLDFYAYYYPLSYKHAFREIIEPELNKNEQLKLYFDHWGSRVYAFSSELGTKLNVNKSSSIDSIDFNFQKLASMGGQYILSGVRIKNPGKNLRLLKTFESQSSPWKVDLYQVVP